MPARSAISQEFDRWLLAAVALVIVLVLGLALTLDTVRRASEASTAVSHTHEVMDALSQIRLQINEASAAQRTYTVKGGDHIPVGIADGFANARKQLERFDELTDDNSNQQAQIRPVKQLIDKLDTALTDTAVARRDKGQQAAVELALKGTAVDVSNQLYARLEQMDRDERLLLRDRLAEREASGQWALFVGLFSGLAAILAVVVSMALLRRYLKTKFTATEEIAAQRERLRVTLASIGDAIITTDQFGRVVDLNSVAEQLTRWKRDEAVGQRLEDVFVIVNETTRQPVPSPAERALSEGVIVGLANHTILIGKDGTEHGIDDSAAPIRTDEGQIIGCVLVFRDISQRRALERQAADRYADASLLATIVATSNDAIISKSLDGTIKSWNAGAERLFGYSPDEAAGKSISMLFTPDRLDEEQQIVTRLRQGERIEHFETVRVRKDGSLVDVSLTISPIADSDGTIVGASKIVRDITQRRQGELLVRESEERFRTLADNMSQFAWMADAKGLVFWYNRRWYDYTGTKLADSQGWGWRMVVHPDHVDRVVAAFQARIDAAEPWQDLFPIRGQDGQYRWFLTIALPVRGADGKVARWLCTNTDVTQQIEAEDRLRQADQAKNEFLAMLAHELRNPLAPIRNGLELMAREQRLDPPSLELVQQQVSQLVRLVDDLLDVSRIMRGKIELRMAPVELGKLVRYAVDSIGGLAQQRGQSLKTQIPDEPIWLMADAVRLSQVIGNLLNNASKYSDHGGRIDVSVIRSNDSARIELSDTGIGIEPEFLSSVFELFSQAARSLDRAQGGLGVGLTVVQQLVALHGGRVDVKSDGLGKGSTFIVELPIDPVATEQAMQPSQPNNSDAAPPRRVLIVDDNVGAAWMLSRLVAKLGEHQVETAHDGPTAIAKALAFRPEVVFLDIGLPGMDGYAVAADIRNRPECAGIHLVALTGYGQDEDRRRSREAGFDRHLVKPADINQIEELLLSL